MRKIIFIIVLSLFWSNLSFADKWTRYGETKSLTIYYEQKSWIKDGSKTYINILYDLKKPNITNEGTVNSMIKQREHDCKEMKSRTLKTLFFETKMGKGKYFASRGENEWKKINEYTSLDGSLFKAACQIE